MQRFQREFPKWLRGDAPSKVDRDVSARDIADKNLILFGDPGGNALIARILGELPIRWTRDAVEIGGRSYAAGDHLPALIFPNPLNPDRYVVLNSGHTFHANSRVRTPCSIRGWATGRCCPPPAASRLPRAFSTSAGAELPQLDLRAAVVNGALRGVRPGANLERHVIRHRRLDGLEELDYVLEQRAIRPARQSTP